MRTAALASGVLAPLAAPLTCWLILSSAALSRRVRVRVCRRSRGRAIAMAWLVSSTGSILGSVIGRLWLAAALAAPEALIAAGLYWHCRRSRYPSLRLIR
jgi:hypothetical protein